MDEKIAAGGTPARGQPLTAIEAMSLAIAQARLGSAHVSPNPAVGCVILSENGSFLSAGFHEKFGGPHAEVNALKKLTDAELRAARVFVTLEPCAHEGKTPSCAKALAQLPLTQVIYGLRDPNPLVSGQGAQIVKAAGIICHSFAELMSEQGQRADTLKAELEASCEAFLWNHRHRQVFVSLKVAASLDGRTALADGTSKWITGEAARESGHELRAFHDAVLIGSGTLEKDDPSLNVRHPIHRKRNKVVILDSEGRLKDRRWKLHESHTAEEILWLVAADRAASGPSLAKAKIAGVQRNVTGAGLSPEHILQALWAEGVRSVLIEGGGRVAGAFLKNAMVNRLHLFMAPVILGASGKSWTEGFEVPSMGEKPVLKNVCHSTMGRDLHFTGLLKDPENGRQLRDA